MPIHKCLAGSLLALLPAIAAQAEDFTLRIGSGHPSAPAAYVSDMENLFVPEVTRRLC